jgi:deoxyribodipyrimidine photo-lyase
MIELKKTGWMSNRGRQNVASYLIHNLKLPWTWGAGYFEKMLIDYDSESNWGNWLYLSGHGSDPRARVFNIQKQAKDYDPHGLYQEKWLNRR